MKNQTVNKNKISFLWRGFNLQMLLFTIVPLTVILLVVVFVSQQLHYEAMRNMVGDRDLRTVQASAAAIEREMFHLESLIELMANDENEISNLDNLLLNQDDLHSTFNGGIAIILANGELLQYSSNSIDWSIVDFENFFQNSSEGTEEFISILSQVDNTGLNAQSFVIFSASITESQKLVGAISVEKIINTTLGDLIGTNQTNIMVVSQESGSLQLLYHAGSKHVNDDLSLHPGVIESLRGESGLHYYQAHEGEHVVAYTPIQLSRWGLVIEEDWEDIASPHLMTTQYIPLILVPVFLIALFLIWFGANRIVRPLQQLEQKASGLADGDFQSIDQPVGGIQEIQNLQSELIDMAKELKTAQQSLHDYIGAITAGVENERRSIARELHDDTIQNLIAFNQRIQLISINSQPPQKESLAELKELVNGAMVNIRRLIRGLRPIYLEEFGLETALEILSEEIGKMVAIPISFSWNGNPKRLDPHVELSLYRMVQESLQNIGHHSNAERAWVQLDYLESELLIKIRDNGIGFSVPENLSDFVKKGHFGLIGLRERAELINAELKIHSENGGGTTTTIRLKWN